jgi:hypothetical protein
MGRARVAVAAFWVVVFSLTVAAHDSRPPGPPAGIHTTRIDGSD